MQTEDPSTMITQRLMNWFALVSVEGLTVKK